MIQRGDASFDSDSLRRRFVSGSLKVCPLCGTLNVDEAEECFVCWWRGEFDRNPLVVEHKVSEMVDRCPELVGLMDSPVRAHPVRRSLRRLWRFFRAKLDVIV